MALVRREWPDFQELVQRWFEGDVLDKSWLRVEEFVDDKTLVVRAEIPGIDPEKDIDIVVQNGELHIRAERQQQSEHKDKESYRSEFQYGSFSRTVTLPPGTTDADISATYKDGVLEIRAPIAPAVEPAPTKIPITRN